MAIDAHKQNDGPVTAIEGDEFEYRDYIKPLSDQLLTVAPPFTLGVFGGWGAGKTGLMRMLQTSISEDEGKERAITVWFDAWKFDREDAIWRAFLTHVLIAIERKARFQRESADSEKQEKLDDFLSNKLEPLQQQLFRSFDITRKGDMQVNWGGIPKSLMVLLAQSCMPGVNIGSSLLKLFKGGEEDGDAGLSKENVKTLEQAMGLLSRQETKEHFEHIRFLDQFHSEFSGLVSDAKNLLAFDRVVFFIDDLDRCLPDHAIEVLEAIKLFLSNDHCVFVVGVDEEVIHAGLDLRYHSLYGDGQNGNGEGEPDLARRQFHQEYLEKIIQLPFTLPPLPENDVRKFIGSRLEIDSEFVTEVEKRTLVDLMTLGVECNPRKLKRVCYLFNLNWSVAGSRGIRQELRPQIVAKLTVLQLRLRPLYQELMRGRSALLPMLERYWEALEKYQQERGFINGLPDPNEDEQALRDKKITPPLRHPWISPYVENEWLRDFMRWQPAGEREGGAGLFDGLKNIEMHIQLKRPISKKTGVAPDGGATASRETLEIDPRLLQDLLHEDLAIIESAANKVADEDRKVYQVHLFELFNNRETPWRQRVGVGDALGFIGDPRFEGERPWEDEEHWVVIPKSQFYRGSLPGDEQAADYEKDGKSYEIAEFQIGRYPVTNGEYQRFVQATGDHIPRGWNNGFFPTGEGNHPVVAVRWHDAIAYIEWLNGRSDGYRYRLPTEAQWERAARGPAQWRGEENRRQYPWGDAFDAQRCNLAETGLGRTTAAGAFPGGASPEGVLDMAGNVWEWCADWFDDDYYQQGTVDENTEKGEYRVLRGGAFSDDGGSARCACRSSSHPGFDGHGIGFRVARIPRP